MISKNANVLSYRQFNYGSYMVLPSQLSRWLHKLLSHRYVQAGVNHNYTTLFPTLNGNHIRLPPVVGRLVAPYRFPVFIALHQEFGVGSETFVQNHEMSQALERRFIEVTGVRKQGYVLATALIELRKDGKLPKTGRRRDDGFTDFDAAEDAG